MENRTSRLLTLPAEIRVKIYNETGMLLQPCIIIEIAPFSLLRIPRWLEGDASSHHEGLDALANLSRACKQISQEIVPHFYENAIFDFHADQKKSIVRGGIRNYGSAGTILSQMGWVPPPPKMEFDALVNMRNVNLRIPSVTIALGDGSQVKFKGQFMIFTERENGIIDSVECFLEDISAGQDVAVKQQAEKTLGRMACFLVDGLEFKRKSLAVLMNMIVRLARKELKYDGVKIQEAEGRWLGEYNDRGW